MRRSDEVLEAQKKKSNKSRLKRLCIPHSCFFNEALAAVRRVCHCVELAQQGKKKKDGLNGRQVLKQLRTLNN